MTSDQRNLTQGRIAAAHGRLNGIRQVAPPMCTHLIHGSVDRPESTSKPHLDRFSRFCRAHDRDKPTNGPLVAMRRIFDGVVQR